MEDKDFLQDYEIKAIDLGPRIYKIFTFAAAVNLIAIAVIGQTNMLARSACESPFVNRVCSVLDAVYFSSKLLATDAGYVVKEYEETKIKDSDVVWIDQTNVEPSLLYPTGYFQIANRDELAMLEGDPLQIIPSDPILPPAPILPPPSNSPKNPFGTKPIMPKKRDSVVEGDLPDDPLAGIGDEPTQGNGTVADNDPKPGNSPNGNSPLPEVEINKQPLYDFVDGVVEKVNAKKVDLRRQFKVVMNAYITEDGKLDIEKSRWDPEAEQGDPEMILVAKDAVEKVGDSGWLVYLSEQGIKNVKIIFYQDEEKLAADIVSVMPSRNNAKNGRLRFQDYEVFRAQPAQERHKGAEGRRGRAPERRRDHQREQSADDQLQSEEGHSPADHRHAAEGIPGRQS